MSENIDSITCNFKEVLHPQKGYLVIIAIVFLLCIICGMFKFWYTEQPLDISQVNVLKALIESVSKVENRAEDKVWLEIYRTYRVHSYADLSRADFEKIVDQLSLRLQK